MCAHALHMVLWELKKVTFLMLVSLVQHFLGLCYVIQLLPILYGLLKISVYF